MAMVSNCRSQSSASSLARCSFTLLVVIVSCCHGFSIQGQRALKDIQSRGSLLRQERISSTLFESREDMVATLEENENVGMPLVDAMQSLEDFVMPATTFIDETTGGYVLSCSSLAPEDETSPLGMAFLATNICYGMVGLLLTVQGSPLFGIITEGACLASFAYHYTQLKFRGEANSTVKLALLVDYFFAFAAILLGAGKLFAVHQLPPEIIGSVTLALGFLGASWVWVETFEYILLHSMWHVCSAYTGYLIASVAVA